MANECFYKWDDGKIEPCVICGVAGQWLIIGLYTDKGCIQTFSKHVDFKPQEGCKSYRFTKVEHLTFKGYDK